MTTSHPTKAAQSKLLSCKPVFLTGKGSPWFLSHGTVFRGQCLGQVSTRTSRWGPIKYRNEVLCSLLGEHKPPADGGRDCFSYEQDNLMKHYTVKLNFYQMRCNKAALEPFSQSSKGEHCRNKNPSQREHQRTQHTNSNQKVVFFQERAFLLSSWVSLFKYLCSVYRRLHRYEKKLLNG